MDRSFELLFMWLIKVAMLFIAQFDKGCRWYISNSM